VPFTIQVRGASRAQLRTFAWHPDCGIVLDCIASAVKKSPKGSHGVSDLVTDGVEGRGCLTA